MGTKAVKRVQNIRKREERSLTGPSEYLNFDGDVAINSRSFKGTSFASIPRETW